MPKPECVYDADDETLEELGRNGLRMIQRNDGFRFGEDTVLLSYFSASVAPNVKRGTRALELGAGYGAASLLLSARRPDVHIDGIEVDGVSLDVFARNIELNHLEHRIRPIRGDIRDFPDMTHVKKSAYDFVFFNPPYRNPKRGPVTEENGKSKALLNARFEMLGSLTDFIRVASDALRPGGIAAIVFRTLRLPEVIRLMSEYDIEPTVLRIVYPTVESQSTLFLLAARKGGKPGGFALEAPLILRTRDREMSKEMIHIYTKEDEYAVHCRNSDRK
ncbi:MAG: methyltransferase [Clostridiales bacterium]|nr:methyltransferase [Clostridiales bacterium]